MFTIQCSVVSQLLSQSSYHAALSHLRVYQSILYNLGQQMIATQRAQQATSQSLTSLDVHYHRLAGCDIIRCTLPQARWLWLALTLPPHTLSPTGIVKHEIINNANKSRESYQSSPTETYRYHSNVGYRICDYLLIMEGYYLSLLASCFVIISGKWLFNWMNTLWVMVLRVNEHYQSGRGLLVRKLDLLAVSCGFVSQKSQWWWLEGFNRVSSLTR